MTIQQNLNQIVFKEYLFLYNLIQLSKKVDEMSKIHVQTDTEPSSEDDETQVQQHQEMQPLGTKSQATQDQEMQPLGTQLQATYRYNNETNQSQEAEKKQFQQPQATAAAAAKSSVGRIIPSAEVAEQLKNDFELKLEECKQTRNELFRELDDLLSDFIV